MSAVRCPSPPFHVPKSPRCVFSSRLVTSYLQTCLFCVAGSVENLPSRGTAMPRPFASWLPPTTSLMRKLSRTSRTTPKTSSAPCWRKTGGWSGSYLILAVFNCPARTRDVHRQLKTFYFCQTFSTFCSSWHFLAFAATFTNRALDSREAAGSNLTACASRSADVGCHVPRPWSTPGWSPSPLWAADPPNPSRRKGWNVSWPSASGR